LDNKKKLFYVLAGCNLAGINITIDINNYKLQ